MSSYQQFVQKHADERAAAALALPAASGREEYAEYLARATIEPIDKIGRLLRAGVPKKFRATLAEHKLNDRNCVWPENRDTPALPRAPQTHAPTMPGRASNRISSSGSQGKEEISAMWDEVVAEINTRIKF